VVLPVTTTLTVVDLTSCPGHPSNAVTGPDQIMASGTDKNPLGHYITFEADGVDTYYALCGTLSLANSLSMTTGASVSNNALVTTNVNVGMWKLVQGDKQSQLAHQGPAAQTTPPGANSSARYLGFQCMVGSGTFRFYQSSP